MPKYLKVSDEVWEWIEHWAAKEGDGGFQDKAAELFRSRIPAPLENMASVAGVQSRTIRACIDALEAMHDVIGEER